MLRAVRGAPPAASQQGLKESLIQKGYFLPCVARPEEDLEVTPPVDDDVTVSGRIAGIEALSPTVSRVRLALDAPFDYRPGQFVNLVRADGLIRSYSVASLPDHEADLELHVRHIPGGRMSGWLCGGEALASAVEVRGPAGDCFYLGDADEPLLLIGTGTGLAPLYGIARDALARGHRGEIALYHGGLNEQGLYLRAELAELCARHANFSYLPCVLEGEAEEGMLVGAIDQLTISRHADLARWRIYLCGDPALVESLRKKLFLAGAGLRRIHADAFLMACN
jgi:NAD(P)H-flavin reductase